ncbi:MAG TPA: signal peptide peptidase SppA [candidate division Zixibacteria bacterium]|nr:signal peptide peptidase SppA [candidate division Zixibacteria bacterium]MDD4917199.1 signal peptide peptidase SppA [candidate division Zixibacteria bacterium]MDM7971665.1 signal peptide peptidase SppA [candidate division Zixibacteria bacterium]HOD67606.1 signal peptide peptidase SppA [candidate division Zixibacteria bacterium]HPI32654.1 signal peptide peptidase SppA [candidate division Zixibacteria bacterium]
MARTRDVVVGVVIAVVFLGAIGFFGLMIAGMLAESGEFRFAGLGGNIGLVEVYGTIDEEMGRPIIDLLDEWKDNSGIRAIVLHVNSPGGGVAISQEIYDAVKRARDVKPVVASMASVCASGGYYIACAADRVVANPGSLTGSIGVIFQFYTAGKLMEKVGIETETVKSGELKDVGSLGRAMTEEERLMLRSVVMDTYEQFVQAVADGRGLDPEQIYPLADGSIFTGLQALNLHLVDTLGGLNEAIQVAADLADLEGTPRVVRPVKRRQISVFDLLGGLLRATQTDLVREMSGPELLYLYR